MKVLQINSVCGCGSTGRIATDIYKILVDQGHECLIAYGRGTAPEGIKTIKIGTDLDNYIHVAKTRLFDKHGFSSTKATEKFINKAKEYDPDVIHLHNIHGYYINIELLFNYLKEANKPVIWTLHDCWTFTGHCAYFDYVACDKWKIGCGNCEQKNEYPSSKFIDNSSLNYEKKKALFTSVKDMTIVTPSKWLADLVKKSFLKKYSVKVINNGIDLEVFKPTESDFRQRYGLDDKFIILGVASGWTERKGLKYLIELAQKLDSSYQVVIVGVSDKQTKDMPNNVIGISRTNNVMELVKIYSAADIFVNPTLEDNYPTTNLEALACGTPIVTFNTGGSIESINENTGIVVEKGNLQQLKKEILNIKVENNLFYENDLFNRVEYIGDKNNRFKEYIILYSSNYL